MSGPISIDVCPEIAAATSVSGKLPNFPELYRGSGNFMLALNQFMA
jgi:hypothetical protein